MNAIESRGRIYWSNDLKYMDNETRGGSRGTMSYDFLMMKPAVEIRGQADIGEDTLLVQEPGAVVEALSTIAPTVVWRREPDGAWFGAVEANDGRYEFRVGAEPELVWRINASRRARTHNLVPTICRALGLIAFDGQAMVIIGSDGMERQA
jgi:hypothetical protein